MKSHSYTSDTLLLQRSARSQGEVVRSGKRPSSICHKYGLFAAGSERRVLRTRLAKWDAKSSTGFLVASSPNNLTRLGKDIVLATAVSSAMPSDVSGATRRLCSPGSE